MPALPFDTERARLFAQVRELAARHGVKINLRCAGTHVTFKGGVEIAHRLPVKTQLADRLVIKAGIARTAFERGDNGAERRLRRQPAHGIERRIDNIGAGVDSRQHRGRGGTAGVMGMEVDGQ